VIAPPDGDLAAYLASLQRLRGLDCGMLLPAHGPPTVRPRQVLDEYLAHRARREEQLVAALAGPGPHALDALTARLYPDLAPELRRLARLQVWAGLEKLQAERRAANDGDYWSAVRD
jgi:glyoxylase-like metal-dependent hydrolase (beta-lactamase superfamily II)